MPRFKPAALLFLFAAALSGRLSAAFSLPTVDLSNNKLGAPTSVAIWSTLDVSMTAGSWISVVFPPNTTVPSTPNLASCECLAMKYSLTSTSQAKAFSSVETLILSGAINAADRTVSFQLPVNVDKGKIYFRFRASFGLVNPTGLGVGLATSPGFATLTLVDTDGNSLASKGYFIALSYTANIPLAPLSGLVTYSGTSRAASGVLVMASTDGVSGMHPTSLAGPGGSLGFARATTSRAYTAATNYDGTYKMLLPPGTYTLMAVASRVTPVAGVKTLQGVSSSASTVTMAGTAVSSNITTFPAFP